VVLFERLQSSGKGSSSAAAAVKALLKGSAEASKHTLVFDPTQQDSKTMN